MNKSTNPHSEKPEPVSVFEDSILAEIRQTFWAMRSAFGGIVGTTQARLRVFQQLKRRGELSQAELGQSLGVDGAVITRLVKQMEAEGVLTRRPDPNDNRFTLVLLTDQGQQQIEELFVKVRSMLPVLLQGLSEEEIRCARGTLARIRQNAEDLASRNTDANTSMGAEKILDQ